MRIIIFAGIVILSGAYARGQNSQMLKCRVNAPDWKALFQLDAVGNGQLDFKSTSSGNHSCALKLRDISVNRRLTSEVIIEFDRSDCTPGLPAQLEREIFESFTLTVPLHGKGAPGIVQWTKRHQPDSCVVERIDPSDIEYKATKWAEGTWGRFQRNRRK